MSSTDTRSRILVTGGTGYIGSHACVALIEAGYSVLVLDNLCNSAVGVLDRIERITGVRPGFMEGDIRDRDCLNRALSEASIEGVMHFAGLKAVGESVKAPEAYHDNNVEGSRVLLNAMQAAKVRSLVFSSSATVYGDPDTVPITEDSPLRTTNPYGQTKLDIEEMLREMRAAEPRWRFACLRYFNPVGAHVSGLIGEDPKGIPDNLMPYISQVAVGRRERLQVFGGDYDTVDGTGVRDYIHVLDLVRGHVDALRYLEANEAMLTINLGTGNGVSVLQMIRAFEQANDIEIPFDIVDRRAGDIAECWADATLAEKLLGWRSELTLEDMCRDTWRWQRANPEGYAE